MKRSTVMGVVLIAAAVAVWLGQPAYRASKERKFAAQAEEGLLKGEHRRALVNAQQVLVLNSNNLAACLVMAELAELSRSANALIWRRRVAEIEPSRSNRLVLAAAALRYEPPPFPTAVQTLDGLREATNDAGFHLVSAQLALKQNRLADGERHIQQAIQLEPANDSHKINLNVVRLESRDLAVSAVARAELAQRTNSAQALRALVVHFAGRRQFAEAAGYSSALVQLTNSLWSDRLDHLGVLRGAQSPDFDRALSALQAGAATNAFQASELVTRLNELGLAERAIQWVQSLPAVMQKETPLPMAVASSHFALGRWRDLEGLLTAGSWDDREFARKALLTYAVRKQGAPEVAAAHWRDASRLVAAKPELIGALAQMAAAWGWTNETTVLLWQAAKEFPRERWPLESLQSIYMRLGDTRRVLEVNALALERQPGNAAAQNNWAALALLLQTNLSRAHELARQVYDRDTNNFAFVSTYAWSLRQQGRGAEALRLMETIPAAQLADPALAGYYATLLLESGQKEQARTYLDKTTPATLLPEEREMVAAARRRL